MCGILFTYLRDDEEVAIVRQCFMRLAHRGPDHTGEFVGDGFFMGCHRLAIVQPDAAGNQPLHRDGSVIACNGQIYNATSVNTSVNTRPLRSDVDAILNAFCDDTFASVDELALALDGDFAFVVMHGGVLYAGRDPVGVRPLFYGLAADSDVPIAFASEAKALAGLPHVTRVKVFPPGHVYTSGPPPGYTSGPPPGYTSGPPPGYTSGPPPGCTSGGTFRSYTDIYSPGLPLEELTDYDGAADAVRDAVVAAVIKRVENSDRPIAFLCSGGLDSSIVLSVAHAYLTKQGRGQDLHAFSMQYGSSGDDAMYAGMLCTRLGVKLTRVAFEWADVEECIQRVVTHVESYDPASIRTAVPAYLLAKHIRENTDYKVILSGEGADEVFEGYNMFMRATDGAVAALESQRLVKDLHMFDLLRADRTFAAWGLEIRVPFLDIDLLRLAFRLPGEHKLFKDGVEKALLRHAFRGDPDLLASRVLDRMKERFSDGCGFGYVPALLKHWAPDANTLRDRESAERAVYKAWFDESYPGWGHLLGSRNLAEWCGAGMGDASDGLLLA